MKINVHICISPSNPNYSSAYLYAPQMKPTTALSFLCVLPEFLYIYISKHK